VILQAGKVPYITTDTMCKFLDGWYSGHFDEVKTFDCRFAYEHAGGRIKDAINILDPLDMLKFLSNTVNSRTALVFHCEFSQMRGPELAGFFRRMDRKVNEDDYPRLCFPHVYILNGGYAEFYRTHPERCSRGYVKMHNEDARMNGDLASANAAFKERLDQAKRELGLDSVSRGRSGHRRINPLSPERKHRRRTFGG
jgi:M-phase inducer tyrosine phosphatase